MDIYSQLQDLCEPLERTLVIRKIEDLVKLCYKPGHYEAFGFLKHI